MEDWYRTRLSSKLTSQLRIAISNHSTEGFANECRKVEVFFTPACVTGSNADGKILIACGFTVRGAAQSQWKLGMAIDASRVRSLLPISNLILTE